MQALAVLHSLWSPLTLCTQRTLAARKTASLGEVFIVIIVIIIMVLSGNDQMAPYIVMWAYTSYNWVMGLLNSDSIGAYSIGYLSSYDFAKISQTISNQARLSIKLFLY